jgi:hypothetical protein
MKKHLLTLLAFIITLAGAYYTRTTGPTKPVKGSIVINNETIEYKLIRTYAKNDDAPVKIEVKDRNITGSFIYKRTPSHDQWQSKPLLREGDFLIAYIPHQPPAGKIMYHMSLKEGQNMQKLTENPITIRFRGDVPAWVMIPHILFMFAAMLLSTRTGLAALFKEKTFKLTLATVIMLGLGGLVFGPIVQKYAFGAYWTGWPLGTDLTDNKTAFAFLVWLFALWKVWKNYNHRTSVVLASLVLLLIYLIPHSMMGSEIDYTKEENSTTGNSMSLTNESVILSGPKRKEVFLTCFKHYRI